MEIVLILIALVIYFIPTIVGSDKRDAGAIFVLNFFLGWTIIGWLGALVWGMTYDKKPVVISGRENPRRETAVDQIMKLTILKDKGAITESEFQKEKDKILNQ